WGDITVIGCVDPRVDPAYVLGLRHGEAAMIRNVGGRVTQSTLRTLAMLAKVRQAHAPAAAPAATRTLVVLHHTRCGINDLASYPDLLAGYFEIAESALATKSVTNPYGSVRVDVDVLTTALRGPDTVVAGLVYDVDTGAVDVVAHPTRLPAP
ncbi:MAG: carbonic anhydrase, partial [Mycobacterium sp.]